MGELGSVFDGMAPAGGADLYATVEVPRAAIEQGVPVDVGLADELPDADGVLHPRVVSPHDPPGRVQLSLPPGTPDGAQLRLRRQGARGADGVGDLYLTVRLTEGALVHVARGAGTPVPAWTWGALTAVVIAILAGVCG